MVEVYALLRRAVTVSTHVGVFSRAGFGGSGVLRVLGAENPSPACVSVRQQSAYDPGVRRRTTTLCDLTD
jgi:hypothetical protein